MKATGHIGSAFGIVGSRPGHGAEDFAADVIAGRYRRQHEMFGVKGYDGLPENFISLVAGLAQKESGPVPAPSINQQKSDLYEALVSGSDHAGLRCWLIGQLTESTDQDALDAIRRYVQNYRLHQSNCQ